MRTMKKTAVAAILASTIVAGPAVAHARHWRPYYRPHFYHSHHHVPGPLIGLGIAGAVLGTAAVIDSIVRPRVLYVPPPPPPRYYDDGYRRGYDEGRRDAYEDEYRGRSDDD